MKKLIIILFTFLFILTSCSNPEDIKKIEELESKIIKLENQIQESNIENEKIVIDIIKGEWFTPHAATRKIIFNIDKTYEFHGNNIINGEYIIQNSNIIINDGEKNISLNLSGGNGDDINFYLKNIDEGQYFIKK